jgi:hypothetical protein
MFQNVSIVKIVVAMCAMSSLGCATKVAGLKADPSFTYDTVSSGGVVIGGVVSLVKDLGMAEISTYANTMRTQLQEERADYNIAPMASVVSALGEADFMAMMADYKAMGSLSEGHIQKLKEKVAAGRYLVLSRIEANDVTTDRRVEQDKNNKGKVTGEKIVKIARRNMAVTMEIFDLKEGKRVWSGSITKDKVNKNEYQEQKDGALVAVIKIATKTTETEDQKYPYPEPPADTELLEEILQGFATNMPKK